MGAVPLASEYDVTKPAGAARLQSYWQLIKPGIVFGNLVPVVGGFLLAKPQWADTPRLALVLLAVFCLIASACLVNNYLDRNLDKHMTRTQTRLLARQSVRIWPIFLTASLLLLVAAILLAQLNLITLLVALFGYVMYVWVYTILLKRRSTWQTELGSFAGACPPVIGYCSLHGQVDLTATLLFLLFAFWQIPHSYAVAIFRKSDYQAANIPVLPVVRGIRHTQKMMMRYWMLYIFTGVLLFATGATGWLFLAIFAYFGLRWGVIGCQGLTTRDTHAWARQFFFYSIKVMMGFSLAIILDRAIAPWLISLFHA